MDTLFPDEEPRGPVAPAPLAERMRPRTFDEFVGQQDLLARGKPLREAIERDLLQSIILWGPPGTGKTTLARIIAATTENPSFEVIAALLSRSKVFVLHGLTVEEVVSILQRALSDADRGLGHERVTVDDESIGAIALYANGDARSALNLLELSVAAAPTVDGERRVDVAQVEQTIQRRALLYDKSGEEHYNLISALHKSMRNSDPDGSVYWLARMVEAGEDPLYIARRDRKSTRLNSSHDQ